MEHFLGVQIQVGEIFRVNKKSAYVKNNRVLDIFRMGIITHRMA